MPEIFLTEAEFETQYPLRQNHLNPHAAWSMDDAGCLFETYGPELAFVQTQPANTIWTVVDGDGNDVHILSGFHHVNRIGYLISTKPVPAGLNIECRITTHFPV